MGTEVIEIVERRRRWSTEEKLKVLIDALEPGASVSAVADRHGVSRNLVYTWLRLARKGQVPGLSITDKAAAAFAPVQVASDPAISPAHSLPPRPLAAPRRRLSIVEIVLTNGRVVKVDEGIEVEVLARIIAVLDGGARLGQDGDTR
ncbi:MAG: transposase [Hyphomicrobiaceae bacterium]|nr:transposase [Hyphomicrobiaceae bacterium]